MGNYPVLSAQDQSKCKGTYEERWFQESKGRDRTETQVEMI